MSLGQIKSWNHTHFTTRNGLPSNVIRNCVQDHDGFLWIATGSGLCRYDGNEFKTIYHNPKDTSSIPSDYINYVELTEDGHLLVSTMHGFFVMNTHTHKGKTFSISKRKGWEKLENMFGIIHTHKQLKQIIVYNGTSFFYFDDHFRLIHTVDYPYPPNAVQKHFLVGRCAYLANGDIVFWSGVTERFEYLELATKRILPCKQATNKAYAPLSKIKLLSVFNWDQQNNLWYTEVGKDSLNCFNPHSGKTNRFLLRGDLRELNWTSNIMFPDKETLLMPYAKWDANELYLLPRKELLNNPSYQIHPTSFTGFTVALSSLFVDKDANWWISSLDGLYYVKKEFSHFERIDLPVPYKRKFDWQYVSSVQAINANELLITTFAEHCFLYNRRTNAIQSYLDSVPIERAWDHCMGSIMQLGTHRHLITGCRNYIFENGKLSARFLPENAFERLIASHSVNGFIHDQSHHLWASLQGIGLVKYNFLSEQYQVFPPDTLFPSDQFELTCKDSAGNLFFMHNSTASVWKFVQANQTFVEIRIPNRQKDLDWIRDMAVDNEDNIYLNTHQSLLIYSATQNTLKTLTMRDGLPSNVLNALYYFRNKLYLLSDAGLGILNTRNHSIRLITDKEGLIDNVCSRFMMYDSISQRIYLGGKGCVYRIHPDSCWTIPVAARILIDKVMVNNRVLESPWGSPSFSSNDNNLQITLSSVDFYSGSNRKYYYRFVNGSQSDQWHPSASHQINLLNLPPGKYHLEFKSRDADSKWSANKATFRFTLLAPWYQRWWFYTLLLTGAALSVYFIYRNKIAQIRRIEAIRNKLSRDLHDDIGSTLSSINILSNTAIRSAQQGNHSKSQTSLEKINERTQRLLQNMNEIIWNIKPENDSFDELLSRMRLYALTVLEAKNIDYTLNFPDNTHRVQLDMFVKSNLYLIFKEAINNLVKYSACQKAVIECSIHKNELVLHIEDNGVGFDPDYLTHQGGLLNMQHRASEIHAQLEVQSSPGSGTCIRLQLHL